MIPRPRALLAALVCSCVASSAQAQPASAPPPDAAVDAALARVPPCYAAYGNGPMAAFDQCRADAWARATAAATSGERKTEIAILHDAFEWNLGTPGGGPRARPALDRTIAALESTDDPLLAYALAVRGQLRASADDFARAMAIAEKRPVVVDAYTFHALLDVKDLAFALDDFPPTMRDVRCDVLEDTLPGRPRGPDHGQLDRRFAHLQPPAAMPEVVTRLAALGERAPAASPRDVARALTLAGVVALQSSDPAAARSAWDRSLARVDGSARTRELAVQARCAALAGDDDFAIERLDRALAAAAGADARAMNEIAIWMNVAMRDVAGGGQHVREADAWAHLLLAAPRPNAGAVSRAPYVFPPARFRVNGRPFVDVPDANEMPENDPLPDALQGAGATALDAGDLERAAVLLRESLAANRADAALPLLLSLATLHRLQGDPQDALDALGQAEARANDDGTWRAIGDAYLALGEPRRAKAAFEKRTACEGERLLGSGSDSVRAYVRVSAEYAERTLEEHPNDAYYRVLPALASCRDREVDVARALVAAGDVAGAIARYDALIAAYGAEPSFARERRAEKGRFLAERGDFAGARAELEQAIGEDPSVFTDLAEVCLRLGDRACAERAAAKAEGGSPAVLANVRAELGPRDALKVIFDHIGDDDALAPGRNPTLERARFALETHWRAHDHARALASLPRYEEALDEAVARDLSQGTEHDRLLALARYAAYPSAVAFHMDEAKDDPSALAIAFESVLRSKGRVLDGVAAGAGALRAHVDQASRAKLDALARARADLSRRALAGPGKQDPGAYQAALDAANVKVEELEADLVATSARYRETRVPVRLDAIQARVPPGAALVEIVRYRAPFGANPFAPEEGRPAARYAAYVARAGAAPRAADLGDAESIDALVARMRALLVDPASDPRPVARQLDARVMAPVRALVGDAHDLLVAPDGALDTIPFGALVDERGEWLATGYGVTYLTTGRDLLRLGERREAPRAPPLVVANPDFGGPPSRSAGRGVHAPILNLEHARFEAIPGTAEEAHAIGAIAPDARVLEGRAADAAALRGAHGPRFLHLATHGFFLPDPRAGADDAGGPRRAFVHSGGSAASAPSREEFIANPLLRSGLALAGANERDASGARPGVLTALETASLDLEGTRLVVLSACETGLGEVHEGEGVYGLRRALVLAGAETIVTSLWKVDDEATAALMRDYYVKLVREGRGRGDALREAALAVSRDGRHAHPYYWASFIAIGDWRTLEGREVAPSRPLAPARVTPGGACVCSAPGGGARLDHPSAFAALALLLAWLARRGRHATLTRGT